MISCIYALLFLTATDEIYDQISLQSQERWKQIPHLNRLVLLSDEHKRSFYGSYKVGDTGKFPEIKIGHDIFMTANQNDRDTSLRAYCSPTLSSTKIVDLLVQHLEPAVAFHYPKLEGHVLSPEDCLKAIHKEWDAINKGSPSHEQIIIQSSTCSNSDIIGLAFQGDISVSGEYSRYAPLNNKDVPKLVFKYTLELKDLVSDRQIYAAWHNKNSQMALVWYFGHLHLFERSTGHKLWWPVTDINNPEKNGAIILNFLRNRLGLFERLDKKLGKNTWPRGFGDYLRQISNRDQFSKSRKVYRLMAEIYFITLQIPTTVYLDFLK